MQSHRQFLFKWPSLERARLMCVAHRARLHRAAGGLLLVGVLPAGVSVYLSEIRVMSQAGAAPGPVKRGLQVGPAFSERRVRRADACELSACGDGSSADRALPRETRVNCQLAVTGAVRTVLSPGRRV